MRNPFQRFRKKMVKGPENGSGKENYEDLTDEQLNNPLSASAEAAAEWAMGGEAEEENAEAARLRAELDAQKAEHAALHDKFVRLHAEFDNFRKRTAKERLDLLQTAGKATIHGILPVLDDMERAVAHNTEVADIDAVKQGIGLIYQKFNSILQSYGVKPMHCKGEPFDPDLQEAVGQAPAPASNLKGKVLEVVETGYTLNDKVLRYAKVVVGQ